MERDFNIDVGHCYEADLGYSKLIVRVTGQSAAIDKWWQCEDVDSGCRRVLHEAEIIRPIILIGDSLEMKISKHA